MSTRERIIVALVTVLTIALGGVAILHISGTSSGEDNSAAAAEADAQRLVEQALRAAQSGGSSSAPSPSSPSPTASGSPSGSASPKSQPASPKASPSSSSSG